MPKSIRTLIVDDTVTYRSILQKALETIGDVEVIGTASNGERAIERVSMLRPDLVMLDVEMPVMNGLEALRAIRSHYPDTAVVMVSTASPASARSTIKALEAGAMDFIIKPISCDQKEIGKYIRRHLEPVLFALRKSGQSSASESLRKRPLRLGVSDATLEMFDLLVVGCSTGGPDALLRIIPDLPADLSFPVLVVQHMPSGFTASLAAQLNSRSQLRVIEATDKIALQPGEVILAPGGRHLAVRRYSNLRGQPLFACPSDSPPLNDCRPSIDFTLRTVAAVTPGKVLLVMLTGMGRDGFQGVRALARCGEYHLITQSEDSCVVYGMPRVLEEAGLSHESLELEAIASRIVELGETSPCHTQ